MIDVNKEKNLINNILYNAFNEIKKQYPVISGTNMKNIENDFNILLRALQYKNKIYDFACLIEYDYIETKFVIKIAYNLINSDKPEYEGHLIIKV